MTRTILATALIATLGTTATAQGIQPATTAPATDVTVGTLTGDQSLLVPLAAGIFTLATSLDTTDGT